MITISIAAAAATLGTDLLRDEKRNIWHKNRTLKALGMAGSTAALDCEAELFVGETSIGRFFNLATGAVLDAHYQPLGNRFVPSGARVSLIVRNAAVGNPINVVLID